MAVTTLYMAHNESKNFILYPSLTQCHCDSESGIKKKKNTKHVIISEHLK